MNDGAADGASALGDARGLGGTTGAARPLPQRCPCRLPRGAPGSPEMGGMLGSELRELRGATSEGLLSCGPSGPGATKGEASPVSGVGEASASERSPLSMDLAGGAEAGSEGGQWRGASGRGREGASSRPWWGWGRGPGEQAVKTAGN
jgi:hypothetical protein